MRAVEYRPEKKKMVSVAIIGCGAVGKTTTIQQFLNIIDPVYGNHKNEM